MTQWQPASGRNTGLSHLPADSGEMVARVRSKDWSTTPLGPSENWPEALRIAVGVCLSSRFPMFVWWGPHLINLYNDAYIPILGKRHPDALGKPATELWHEIWPVISAQVEGVMTRGEASWHDRVPLTVERNGFPEEAYFTWSHSPIPDGQGGIGGLICAVYEETERIAGERERDKFAAALRASDHRYRSFIALSSEGIWRLEYDVPIPIDLPEDEQISRMTRDGYLAECNDTMARMHGFESASQIVGGRLSDWVARYGPEQIDFMRAWIRNGYRNADVEMIGIGGDGVRRVFMHGTTGVIEDGKLLRAWGTQRDVTQRVLAEQRVREDSAAIETINEVGRLIAAELDLQTLVQTVTDAATRLTRAAFGAFFYHVTDEQGQPYSLYALSGASRETFGMFPLPRMTDIFGDTLKGAGVVRVADITTDERTQRDAINPADALNPGGVDAGELPVRSYLAVPVTSRTGKPIGGLFFGHGEPGVFTERDERSVTSIAAQAAIAIENARLYDALKSSREEAERGLAQLQAVVGSMAEGVVLADAQGNLIEWNEAALNMHGYASIEEVRKNLATFDQELELSTPAGVVLALADWPMSRVLRGEAFSTEEILVRNRTTNRQWVISYTGRPIRDHDGKLLLALLTLHDVTIERRAQAALRESESRYERAAVAGHVGVWELTLADRRMYLAPSLKEMLGYSDDELENHLDAWLEIVHPDDRQQVKDALDAHFAGDTATIQIELRRRHKSGEYLWMLSQGTGLRDAAGRLYRLVGSDTDITPRKRLEQERAELLESERNARAEAEHTSRMKDEFLATLSHELRTPLNAILGWSQIIKRRDARPGDVAQGLEIIERNARAQAQIIEDLLDMSRIISGKVRLDVQRLDLPAIVQSSVDAARPAADAKNLLLTSNLDPLTGVVVSGDVSRIQQILWNLTSNAIKFTPHSGQIDVKLTRTAAHLEISVTDTGEGIGPEFLPYVFDRFRQADSSTTRRHGGLGLGLSIVKQLAELHGGLVRVHSEGLGHGTTFVVTLPITVIPPEADASCERRPSRTPPMLAGGIDACLQIAGVKVLVVDDEPDAVALIRRLLEDCDAIVTSASSANEAVESVRNARPDVMLSDIGMPDENGYSLIRRVRALGPELGGDVPAVALTAYARAEDRVKAIVAGFQMHVAKPVEPAELLAVVASLARKAGI